MTSTAVPRDPLAGNQRFHFRMPARQFNLVVDFAASVSSPNPFAGYPRLDQQILKSDFDIARPDLGLNFAFLLWRQLVMWSSSALSESGRDVRQGLSLERHERRHHPLPKLPLEWQPGTEFRYGLQAMPAEIDAGHYAGISVMVARHGKLVKSCFYGYQTLEGGEPLRKDAIYRSVVSMTKPIIAVAMLLFMKRASGNSTIRPRNPQRMVKRSAEELPAWHRHRPDIRST